MAYGKLTVICGPMYAGKTTELLKRILWARNGESKAVLVVKPAFDNRYSDTKIVSHDGLSVDAMAVTSWYDIGSLADDAEMVCFDEVQFFQEPHFDSEYEGERVDIIHVVRSLLGRGVDVVCSGLDMDWKGSPFPITADLVAMSDEVLKITANCTTCGRPAAKTFKKVVNDETVELGAADLYEARCNQHWSYRGSEDDNQSGA